MLVIYANPGSGGTTRHLHRHVFVLRREDDGQVKQPVRLLPVLEAANPGAGPGGAGGPGPDGGAGTERRRERRFLPGGGGQSGPRHFQPVTARPELARSRHGGSGRGLNTAAASFSPICPSVSLQDFLSQFTSFTFWRAPLADVDSLLAGLNLLL